MANKRTGIELCIHAAGAKNPRIEVHELQDMASFLERAWELLSPGQRLAFMADMEVGALVEDNLPGLDYQAAFDKLVVEQRKVFQELQKQKPAHSDIYSAIVLEFPGFLNDTDINGGDLVDWVAENVIRRDSH